MSFHHRSRTKSAAIALHATTDAFLSFLDRLPDDDLARLLPGGWSPAGHAVHLALTNDVFAGVLSGGAVGAGIMPFTGASDYSDGTWSMDAPPPATAPPILLPPPGIGRAAAVHQLRESIPALVDKIQAVDPETAALCVRLPWGTVSLYQMTEWAAGHTMRHLSQINREMQMAAMR